MEESGDTDLNSTAKSFGELTANDFSKILVNC